MTEDERNATLEEIGKLELEMFLAIKPEGGPAPSQERPETFALMRLMTLSTHSDEFLLSYLDDLKAANAGKRNLFLAKYGDEKTETDDEPLREEIVAGEIRFLEDAARAFPDVFKPGDPEFFKRLLRNELRALSPASLEIYADEIAAALESGRNPAIERHNWLRAKFGKPPLA